MVAVELAGILQRRDATHSPPVSAMTRLPIQSAASPSQWCKLDTTRPEQGLDHSGGGVLLVAGASFK